MSRTMALRRTALACCIVLVTYVSVIEPLPALGQTSPVAQPVPGLDGIANASITQVTRDGTRIVVRVTPPAGSDYTLVLDTRTAATVFDSRLFLPNRPHSFASAMLSPDGEFLAAWIHRQLHGSTFVDVVNLTTDQIAWSFFDAFTASQVQAVADGATHVAAFSVYGPNAGPVVVVGRQGLPAQGFHTSTCLPGALQQTCPRAPVAMTADGAYLAYRYTESSALGTNQYHGLLLTEVAAAVTRVLPIVHPQLESELWASEPSTVRISGDSHWIGFTGRTRSGGAPRAALVHRTTGLTVLAAPALGPTFLHDVSDDARFVLLAGEYSAAAGQQLWVVDRLSGQTSKVIDALDTPLGRYRVLSAHLSGDGSTIVVTLRDGATPDPTPKRTFIAHLDDDGDRLHDGWESTFGLNPLDPADAALDPDSDGRTNAQEYAAGTHPRGTPVRYFAEGASGTFFGTSLALYNPTANAVTANVRFLGPDGVSAAVPVQLPATGPAYLDPDTLSLPFTEFSSLVESPVPLVAERRMTWDRSRGYGSHSGTGVSAPAMEWHFAEGATIAGFQTFFLLQNPGDEATSVSMRYLLPSGTVHERTHIVPAQSRLTVWANQEGPPLDAAEFATSIVSQHPIVAERAMYRDAPGETFAAGSVGLWRRHAGLPRGSLPKEPRAPSSTRTCCSPTRRSWPRRRCGVRTRHRPGRSRRHFPAGDEDAMRCRRRPGARSGWRKKTRVSPTRRSAHSSPARRRSSPNGPCGGPDRRPSPGARTMRRPARRLADTRGQSPTSRQTEGPGGWDTFLMIATTEPNPAQVRVDVSCANGTRLTRTLELSAAPDDTLDALRVSGDRRHALRRYGHVAVASGCRSRSW